MQKHLLTILAVASVVACGPKTTEQADYNVVPLPESITLNDGDSFILKPSTVIVSDEQSAPDAEFLKEYIMEMTGLDVKKSAMAPSKNYILVMTSNEGPAEGYEIDIRKESVTIKGNDVKGTFYGVQTLRKALPVTDEPVRVEMKPAVIKDSPRFAYRGLHLDVCRHFFPASFVKKYIDLMALHNINKFHWHLTEDQGWRVEIKAYPKLTEIGAYRNGTMVGKDWDSNDGVRYGGFYTQEEIKDIVAYAAERHIEIIPEVDLPGHMMAALASYPELGCTGGPYEVNTKWGVMDEVLCAGNDKVYDFLEAVLNEFAELFPGEYFHIGGDECPKVRWEKCPACQAKIKELGIKGNREHSAESQLQNHVMAFAADIMHKHGKKVIGWDELLEGGGVEDIIVMSWRGEEGCINGSRTGHDVIMTSCGNLYFDYYQADEETEPLAIGGYIPVEKVYNYEPVPAEIAGDPELVKHVLGVQANLWTEYIATEEYAEYMAIPRVDALSELQWTDGKDKNYASFLVRLEKMRKIYDKLGYNYAKHVFNGQSE